jgi:hypothetical protein
VTAPGNVEKALAGIRTAATPERVNQDFVKTILKIPGGSGNQMTSFLRKVGFAGTDGAPTEIYTKFRNPATSGKAAAEALKIGYKPLYVRNEFMHKLSDEKLRGLIVEETGQESDSSAIGLVLACIKALRKYVDSMEEVASPPPSAVVAETTALSQVVHKHSGKSVKHESVGLNLAYTINLNLPATSDVAVFNAIFKSLKENLLTSSDE